MGYIIVFIGISLYLGFIALATEAINGIYSFFTKKEDDKPPRGA